MVDKLLGIEIIHTLILTGVSAVGETFTDSLKGFLNALTEIAGEDRGFGGSIICKFTGVRTGHHDLTLFNNNHALPISHGNTGTIGDDVVISFRVGGTSADALLPLGGKHLLWHSLAVEKILPLIGKSAAQRADI